jgi:hypothetical protein
MKEQGFMGAILLNADTFLVYVEYVLHYHAFCLHSYLLLRVLQEDYDFII